MHSSSIECGNSWNIFIQQSADFLGCLTRKTYDIIIILPDHLILDFSTKCASVSTPLFPHALQVSLRLLQAP